MRVLLGLLVIGAATFVAAYYVPLLRAHQALTRMSEESGAKTEALEAKVKKLETDLASASGERDKLSEAEHARQSSSQQDTDRVSALSTSLSDALKKHAAKNLVTVSASKDAVRVLLKAEALFPADKPELNPGGAAVLCDVSRAAGSHKIEVTINTHAVTAPAESAWAVSSEAAGRIATQLEQKCGRKGLTSVSVRGAEETAPRDVEIRVLP